MKYYKALLFGSIGSIVETSEIQRKSFNKAFKQYGLDWNWTKREYLSLLSKSGGKVNILKELKLRGEVHVIGDGYTDYEIKKEGLANYFYLFIENIKRESVVKSADYLLKSLDQFIKIIK